MPTLSVISGWTGVVSGKSGIGYWKVNANFQVGGSPSGSAVISNGDITPFVRKYEITRGRSAELDKVGPGRLTLTLYNPTSIFTPLSSSVLTGSLIPGIAMNLYWTASGSTFQRFSGVIDTYHLEPTVAGDTDIVIECVDKQDNFQRQDTRTTLYLNVQSGSLVNDVLDAAGFSSACRAIDAGQDNYPYAFFDQIKIDNALDQVIRTEYGFGFIRGDGAYVFHDRFFRQLNATASATWNQNAISVKFVRDAKDLYTQAAVTTQPRVISPFNTVWTLQTPITIGPSSTASFFGNYIDPATCANALAAGVVAPVVGTGVKMNSNASATGTDLSSYLSTSLTAFAQSFKMVASNAGPTTGYIVAMTVTGSPIVSYNNAGVGWIDPTACGLYGLRTLTYDAQLISDATQGQALAQFLVNRYSSPSNIDRVQMTLINDTDADWQNILARELDSKVLVTAKEIGATNYGFFVGYLDENYDAQSLTHTVAYTLETLGANENLLIFDLGVVNGKLSIAY